MSCNNDIKINGGKISITTLNSESNTDGIKAKKSITVKDGILDIDAEGDGIKSSLFSMMNYYLPLKGIAAMHCSANTDMNGENTAIFFGLSGTGKTTLSTDPKRLLIGDRTRTVSSRSSLTRSTPPARAGSCRWSRRSSSPSSAATPPTA